MTDSIEFTVIGTPAPQGSKSFKGVSKSGKGIMVESSKAVKPWREAVKWAALEIRRDLPIFINADCFRGPVVLEIWFTFERPKCHAKSAHHITTPDGSKLVRATEDAITDAGLWEDDARVVDGHFHKRYVGHPEAMDIPGAKISIRRAV